MYYFGDGVPIDYSTALGWYKKAANQGSARGQVKMGFVYYDGKAAPKDYTQVMAWYQKAAEQANPDAEHDLGIMYEKGESVPQDFAKAMEWFQKAAGQGDADSEASIGIMYYEGEGVPKDTVKASVWIKKAAEQGNAPAQDFLASLYMTPGVGVDYAKAMEWYKKAADQGDADAQYAIGELYEKGEGVPQDYAQAMKWYAKAAGQGDADSQEALGIMYYRGEGVASNSAEAMDWFMKAANQGNADAQTLVGAMYASGEGTSTDYAKAREWLNKAADQGNAKAEKLIGDMYLKAQGVPQDNNLALSWYKKAAVQGDGDAKEMIDTLSSTSLAAPTIGSTATITLAAGDTKIGKVVAIEPDGVSILTSDGGARIDFAEMSPEEQKRWNYDPQAAANYTAQQVVARQAEKDKQNDFYRGSDPRRSAASTPVLQSSSPGFSSAIDPSSSAGFSAGPVEFHVTDRDDIIVSFGWKTVVTNSSGQDSKEVTVQLSFRDKNDIEIETRTKLDNVIADGNSATITDSTSLEPKVWNQVDHVVVLVTNRSSGLSSDKTPSPAPATEDVTASSPPVSSDNNSPNPSSITLGSTEGDCIALLGNIETSINAGRAKSETFRKSGFRIMISFLDDKVVSLTYFRPGADGSFNSSTLTSEIVSELLAKNAAGQTWTVVNDDPSSVSSPQTWKRPGATAMQSSLSDGGDYLAIETTETTADGITLPDFARRIMEEADAKKKEAEAKAATSGL